MNDPNTPFYHKHKVVELTCPHCCRMLSFMFNQTVDFKYVTVYTCACGRWYKDGDMDMKTPITDPSKWRYEATEVPNEHKE